MERQPSKAESPGPDHRDANAPADEPRGGKEQGRGQDREKVSQVDLPAGAAYGQLIADRAIAVLRVQKHSGKHGDKEPQRHRHIEIMLLQLYLKAALDVLPAPEEHEDDGTGQHRAEARPEHMVPAHPEEIGPQEVSHRRHLPPDSCSSSPGSHHVRGCSSPRSPRCGGPGSAR